ncbi:MAG: hypothetical protein ACRECZ_00920, partial [Methylocella sp.]
DRARLDAPGIDESAKFATFVTVADEDYDAHRSPPHGVNPVCAVSDSSLAVADYVAYHVTNI